MAWKFRKRLRLFPGFSINLSKSGMSATVGIRGLNVNIGRNGTFLNTGIPGTGIYDRQRISVPSPDTETIPSDGDKPTITPEPNPFLQNIPADSIEIRSFVPELLTSDGFFGLKESIVNAQEDKANLLKECNSAKSKQSFSLFLLIISYILLFGIFIKWFRNNYRGKKQDASEVRKTYEDFKLKIDFDLDSEALSEYIFLENTFDVLSKAQKIWDITTLQANDRVRTRSAAASRVSRVPVKFERGQLDYINAKQIPLKLHNANGGDLYVYPAFLAMPSKTSNAFALIDFRDLQFEHHSQRFIEEEPVPSDSQVVGQTWRCVNKDGSPDRRFNNNHQIPIVHYYEINFKTEKGLNESYTISDPNAGLAFATAFEKYSKSLQKLKWSGVVRSDLKP